MISVKKLLYITVLIFSLTISSNSASAQFRLPDNLQLSDSSYISLLTCDPGNQLYSGFGHSAVGVVDYKKRINIVFNYGTFSFNTPNFYLKFAAGKLNYKLSISSYQRFLKSYEAEGRMVVEQRLNLSQQQKQAFFMALMENYRPENREYQYDFFFDNCATRIIDVLEDTMKDSLVNYPEASNLQPTFRNLIDEYLVRGSWSDLGIDIALGSVIDVVATEKEQAFLPHYLANYFDNCKIGNRELVAETKIVLPDNANFAKTPFLLTPWFVFWALFSVITILSIILRKKPWVIADRLIFSTIGLIGIIVLLLWFITDHDATAGNVNFIWANPLLIILALFVNGKQNVFVKYGSVFFIICNLVVLIGWQALPQEFNPIFIPIILFTTLRLVILCIRSWTNRLL